MAVMGFPEPPAAKKPSLYELLQTGLLGPGQSYGGLLSPQDQQAARQQAMLSLGTNLMAAGGPSPVRTSLGQAIGPALQAAQQQKTATEQDMLQAMLLRTKIAQAKNGGEQPSDVRSYEYAKANGYQGTFEDWKRVAAAAPTSPAGIQEFEYFQKLSPEQQQQFLKLQRQPTVPQLSIINGVPTLVDRISGTQTPLTTLPQEISAVTQKASAESEAKAKGTATGEAWGALAKKGINALNVMESLELAEPLIDVATGSTAGAAADKVAAFFGKSLPGDQAIGQLKIIQANLMTNMPRMEGPQSDRDVQLYREAAGELGDPKVPAERKRANLTMIRALQQKYAEMTPDAATPKRVRKFNPATGKIE